MIKRCTLLLFLFWTSVQIVSGLNVDYRVTPLPDHIKAFNDKPFVIDSSTVIVYEGNEEDMKHNAFFLQTFVYQTTRFHLPVKDHVVKNPFIIIRTSPRIKNKEGYELHVTAKRVTITGASAAGVFYGIQTLRKSLPVQDKARTVELPAVMIVDNPQFAYRGMMLDCGRHFFPVSFIKTFIDMLALHNMNVFHWHLSDDQGWRFEVKKYPKLTGVGSLRKSTVIGHNSDVEDGIPYGGYYTQDECREIVKYAAERFITVIPEIDMPGHTQSALAAYPELGCTGGPYHVSHRWGVHEEVLCMGSNMLNDFVKDVLDELMNVFPSPVIHIGGDECRRTRWETCSRCEALAKRLNTSIDGLQVHFTQMVEKEISSHGRRMIGWDEILNDSINNNAMVMSWHGIAPGIRAAKAGYNVVMTPKPYAYFDYYQSDKTFTEPLAIGGYVPLDSVYAYNPLMGIPSNIRFHIIGVQANLWTEYIACPSHAEYMMMPRMAAISEAQWVNSAKKKDYCDFKMRLLHLTKLYDRLGYVYAHHFEKDDPILSQDLFEPFHKFGNDTLYVKVKPGIHRISRPITLKGKYTHPVVFYGEGKTESVICGSLRIGGWQSVDGFIWKTTIPEMSRRGKQPEQFFVNGVRAIRARMPNVGTFHPDSVLEKGLGPGKSQLKIFVEKTELPKFSYGEKPVLTAMHKWDCTRRTIDSININRGYLVVHGDSMAPWKPIDASSYLFIDNYRAALNSPGEWYLDDDGTLYYIPREGEDMATAVCEIPVTSQLLVIDGSNDITFRNISFQYAAYRMPIEGNSPQQGAVSMEAAIELDNVRGVRFEGCELVHTGASGIWMRRNCHNSSIIGCYLYDLGGGGIKIGDFSKPIQAYPCSEIKIENNIIQRVGLTLPQSIGIAISHADHCKVIHNEVSDLTYSAISIGWVWGYGPSVTHDNEIAYNHLHHIGSDTMSDLGGIYTLGKSHATRVHHNVIHDVYSFDFRGWGLYADEGSSDITFDHNLVYGCKGGGFHQHFGRNNKLESNILAWGICAEMMLTRIEDHLSFTFVHNIVYGSLQDQGGEILNWGRGKYNEDWNCYWVTDGRLPVFRGKSLRELQAEGHDQHSIVAEPEFIDPVHGDFRFKSRNVIRKIGFKSWIYSEAGVYGSEKWRDKAKMPLERENAFRKMVLKHEKTVPVYYTISE